ncbi:MAG: hypothetical protein RL721_737 [Candidatus Eisenbacteria bacterium]
MSTHPFDALLVRAATEGVSDLHLSDGDLPRVRQHGRAAAWGTDAVPTSELLEWLAGRLPDALLERAHAGVRAVGAFDDATAGRFRVTLARHAAGVAATFRPIPAEPPTLTSLSLPSIVPAALALDSGLMVVTGPHGSGRSTTLAALVRHLNQTRRGRIVTIEDPIEHRHVPLQCAIGQRELGTHAPSLEDAVRDAERADADVVLLADLHEPAAARAALALAAAGTLVLGSLDAPDASHAVERLVDAHPIARRDAARARLASHLRLVVTQRLVRLADGSGRHLVADAVLAPPTTIAVGTGTRGLALAPTTTTLAALDAALLELVRTGAVHRAEAFRHALDPGALAARATSEAA